jgi:hypothetical protein
MLPFLCLGGILSLTFQQWQDLHPHERLLKVPLTSKRNADYSAERTFQTSPPVGLEIVQDMIRDSQPEPHVLTSRLAHFEENLFRPMSESMSVGVPMPVRSEVSGGFTSTSGGAGSSRNPTSGKPEKAVAPGKPDAPETPADRVQPEKAVDPGKSAASGKVGGGDRADKTDKANETDKADKTDRADRSGGAKNK